MDMAREITEQVSKLRPAMQERVLRFATSLAAVPQGEKGSALREFGGSLDEVSASEMTQAIEAECERVESSGW